MKKSDGQVFDYKPVHRFFFIYLQIPTNYMTGVWKRKVND